MAGEQLMLQLGHHEVPVLQQAPHAAGYCMAHSSLLVPHGHLTPAADDCHRVTAGQHTPRLCKGRGMKHNIESVYTRRPTLDKGCSTLFFTFRMQQKRACADQSARSHPVQMVQLLGEWLPPE